MMFHIVRVLEGMLSLIRFDWKLETEGGSGGWPVGMASILELMQRKSKVRRIMGVMHYETSRRPYYKSIESAVLCLITVHMAVYFGPPCERFGMTPILAVSCKRDPMWFSKK